MIPRQEFICAEAELQALCEEWQKVMRLQDWDVHVKVVGLRVIGDDKLGECSYIINKKTALITILRPEDHIPNVVGWPQDMELTLVHELAHLYFAQYMDAEDEDLRDAEETIEEQAVDAISMALVNVKRGHLATHQ